MKNLLRYLKEAVYRFEELSHIDAKRLLIVIVIMTALYFIFKHYGITYYKYPILQK